MPSNILSNDPRRSESLDKTPIFRPEVTVISRASSLPGNAERLAWVSSANKVDWTDLLCGEGSDVAVDRDSGPVLFEDGLAVGLDFTEGNRSHSGSFKPKAKTTDSREEVEDIHSAFRLSSATFSAALRFFASDTRSFAYTRL